MPNEAGRRKKREHRDKKPCDTPHDVAVDVNTPVLKAFLGYQKELDSKHDRYERIVKLSRDVTIDSKRTIFLLQRIIGHDDLKEEILSEALTKLEEIQNEKLKLIASELRGEDAYQFLRAYSGGIQEYIEALSFYSYCKSGTIIDLAEVERRLVFHETDRGQDECCLEADSEADSELTCVVVPPLEYILGVADLTGELMRSAIHSVGNGDLEKPFQICHVLRQIHSAFLSYGNSSSKEIPRKMSTLRQSLKKVECACYTLQVRGSEFPKHMLVDLISSPCSIDFSDDLQSF